MTKQILIQMQRIILRRHCEPEAKQSHCKIASGIRPRNDDLVSAFVLVLFCLFSVFCLLSSEGFAQEADLKKAKKLEALILANPKDARAIQSLDELSEIYFTEHQYAPLIEFLRKLEKVKSIGPCDVPVGYYIGLCRYHQLKYLEEAQDWKEYFDAGNSYRQELFIETEKISALCPRSSFGARSQALNWLQHKLQNDALQEGSLDKLMEMLNGYAAQEGFDREAVKEAADILSKQGEAALSKTAYSLYAKGLLAQEKSTQALLESAQGALKEGNHSLAEIIYDRYMEISRASLAKDNLSEGLIAIIRQFAADGWNRGKDPAYAEKVFGVLEEACGKSYFNEELRYLRAYNLQRLKEYARSAEEYELLTKDFPGSIYLDEAEFKLGVIHTYLLGNKEKGAGYWSNIIERDASFLEYKSEALYHQSLLSQYAGDLDAASAGYAKILVLILDNPDFKDLTGRASERQKEIQETKPIEYNLKTFLEIAFSSIGAIDGNGLELDAAPYKMVKTEKASFSAGQPQIQTGCLAPELTYLWSGELGSVMPRPTTAEFSTQYLGKGAKVANLAVLSGQDVIGAALEMVEVYDEKN